MHDDTIPNGGPCGTPHPSHRLTSMSLHHFQPNTREEALAQELAERLGDPDGLPVYLKIATRYPEFVILQMLRRALTVPQERIRTSRGALFTWLIYHYGTHAHP